MTKEIINKKETHIVYGIYNPKADGTFDPYTEGYVGVTEEAIYKTRIACHKSGNSAIKEHIKPTTQYVILRKVVGTRASALKVEKHYRPKPNIGLNTLAGGTTHGRPKGSKVAKGAKAYTTANTLQDKKDAVSLVNSGESRSKVASKYGVTVTTIANWITGKVRGL